MKTELVLANQRLKKVKYRQICVGEKTADVIHKRIGDIQ